MENQIKYIRSHAFALDREFISIDEANAHLLDWLDKDAQRIHGTHKEVILDRFKSEKEYLNPLPSLMPECCKIVHRKVDKLKSKLTEVAQNPNREWIKVLRLTEKYEMKQVIEAIRRALAYEVYDYASIVNLVNQQVHPKVIVEEKDCLTEYPQLADVVVSRQPLTCYDALLTEG